MLSPHVAAHGTESVRDVILVRCVDTGDDEADSDGADSDGADSDGAEIEGWGECPTLTSAGYVGETTELAWLALTAGGPCGTMARAAVADARLDARLRRRGVSLADHLGAVESSVPRTLVIGLGAQVPPGITPIKVKVTPATIGRLRELRAAWPDRVMSADANGSFASPDELPRWLDEIGLSFLEQPLAAADLTGHRELRQRISTPIALDESVLGTHELEMAIAADALDLVSIKPARVGGIEAGRRCLDLALAHGLGCFVGGMLETGIGRAGALALAACAGMTAPTDLGPSAQYFAQDICEPLILDSEDRVLVPSGVGLGRRPDPLRLARSVVDFAPVLTRFA